MKRKPKKKTSWQKRLVPGLGTNHAISTLDAMWQTDSNWRRSLLFVDGGYPFFFLFRSFFCFIYQFSCACFSFFSMSLPWPHSPISIVFFGDLIELSHSIHDNADELYILAFCEKGVGGIVYYSFPSCNIAGVVCVCVCFFFLSNIPSRFWGSSARSRHPSIANTIGWSILDLQANRPSHDIVQFYIFKGL